MEGESTDARLGDEAELRLRYERDFAESLIETANVMILLLDTDGKILRYNRYTEQVTGYPLEEIRGDDCFATLVPESDRDAIRASLRRVLRENQVLVGVQPIRTKGGATRYVRWTGKAVRDGQDNILYVLFTGDDITDLREAQERALQAERLAAIGQMITGLAHESRNALQRSQACLDLLARVVKDNAKAQEYIARVQAAQDHLLEIHSQVRNYAAPIVLTRKVCGLDEILAEAWGDLNGQRTGRQVRLHVERPAFPLECEADRSRMRQVFRNILENALAACSDPVEIGVTWAEHALDGGPAVRVCVQDNGPGFEPEQRQRIFEPFYTTKTHGTGLGMSITKRIVEAHGGQIEVGPETGRGAQILITLPRSKRP